MSRFAIKSIAGEKFSGFESNQPLSGFGTTIQMDGKPLDSVRSIDLHIGCDDAVTAKVEVLATDSLDIEVDALAQITVIPLDTTFAIEETPLPNGGRRFKAVRV